MIPTIALGQDRPTRLAKRRVPVNANDSDQDIGAQFRMAQLKDSDDGSSYAPNFGNRGSKPVNSFAKAMN